MRAHVRADMYEITRDTYALCSVFSVFDSDSAYISSMHYVFSSYFAGPVWLYL